MDKQVYTIDGAHFNNLKEFFDEFSSVLIPGAIWGRGLDSFNDILWGGFGTPAEGFVLVWRNSNRSRQVLGFEPTSAFLEEAWSRHTQGLNYDALALRDYEYEKRKEPDRDEARLQQRVAQLQGGYRQLEHQLAEARLNRGATIFDWLVQMIHDHPDIELKLE